MLEFRILKYFYTAHMAPSQLLTMFFYITLSLFEIPVI
jgi:hypothetical protein